MPKVIRITAKRKEGFRRCGIRHPATPTDHPLDRFTEAELAMLKAERNLTVELVDPPKPEGGGKSEAGGKGTGIDLLRQEQIDAAVKKASEAKNGKKPGVKEVEAILGYDIKGDDVDAAWERLKKPA